MPKFLVVASYTAEGLRGLQKDTASGRLAAVVQAVESVGGTLESMHYALGADDVIMLMDLPDAKAAAALGVAASGSGMVRSRATALLTIAEMDQALAGPPDFRAPGR
ncbi:GYD domain-containing protein [Phenylobacterium sp. LjRoot219]|uniref:GYD domain-containing protein n=1 Tax=Phenylobacterium sp. LjRoot219 TaxID=3342283 RepID=UPI003ECE04CA